MRVLPSEPKISMEVHDYPESRAEAKELIIEHFNDFPKTLFIDSTRQALFLKSLPDTVSDSLRERISSIFKRANGLPYDGETLMTVTCKNLDLEAVQSFAETGIPYLLYTSNKQGEVPLLCAYNLQRTDIFEYLLKALDLNFEYRDNCTILHSAFSLFKLETNEEEEAFIQLLEKIVTPENINVQDASGDDKGISALMLATSNPIVVKFLLSKGADPALKSALGNTALHYACKEGDLESVKLLANQTSTSVQNNEGKTPLDCARDGKEDSPNQTEYDAIIDYLTKPAEPSPAKKQKIE